LFRLTHSSLNAVTSSCVPESSLLELGALELRTAGSEGGRHGNAPPPPATGLGLRSGAWPRRWSRLRCPPSPADVDCAERAGQSGRPGRRGPSRSDSAGPGHHRCARNHDHLRHVFGIASRTRPLGAACSRRRHDQPPAAYALARDYFRWRRQVPARCWVRTNVLLSRRCWTPLTFSGRAIFAYSHDLRL